MEAGYRGRQLIGEDNGVDRWTKRQRLYDRYIEIKARKRDSKGENGAHVREERSFRPTHDRTSEPHDLHPPVHVVPQVFSYLQNKGNILASHAGLGFSHIWTNTRR